MLLVLGPFDESPWSLVEDGRYWRQAAKMASGPKRTLPSHQVFAEAPEDSAKSQQPCRCYCVSCLGDGGAFITAPPSNVATTAICPCRYGGQSITRRQWLSDRQVNFVHHGP